VFVLDTGRLHEESLQFLERLRDRYSLPISVTFPERGPVEQLYQLKGPTSFYNSIEDRRECCHIRKLEPLGRALAGMDAWIVGLRRAQSTTRDTVDRFAVDGVNGGRAKLSPLAHVSDERIWTLAEELGASVHPLHRKGFPSIGCAPCTRAVQPGEHPRAGRWWWEDPASKECGLHGRGK
jgi:phosphoadenosine phosphosulfate reductase